MTSVSPAPSPRSPARLWRWIFIGFAICVCAVALEVYQVVTLTSDASALKNELTDTLSQPTRTRVQVTVGPVLCGLVRLGSRFINQIPEEGRLAIRAVRAASVGVYDVRRSHGMKRHANVFRAADEVMEKRGWTRVVGVNQPGNVVLVYVPRRESGGSTQRACVAVCNDEHLVIVSGTVGMEPLMEIVQRHALLARR